MLNLVVMRLQSGEQCFAELIRVNDTDVVLDNVLLVTFDGMRTIAIPYFPFAKNTSVVMKKSNIVLLEPLIESLYSFYCNVVMASTVVLMNTGTPQTNAEMSAFNNKLTELKERFHLHLTGENFDISEGKPSGRVLH